MTGDWKPKWLEYHPLKADGAFEIESTVPCVPVGLSQKRKPIREEIIKRITAQFRDIDVERLESLPIELLEHIAPFITPVAGEVPSELEKKRALLNELTRSSASSAPYLKAASDSAMLCAPPKKLGQ